MFEIMLVLTIITPADKPDLDRKKPMESIEECFTEAQRWVNQDLAEITTRGGVGVAAACGKFKKPGHES